MIDVLFIKHGMLKFSGHREEALELCSRAKLVINLENDYTFRPDPRFLKVNPRHTTWSTVQRPGTQYVNWNVLTWMPPQQWRKPLPWVAPLKQGILYYGAYREGRVPYFKAYLRGDRYPVTISSFRGVPAFRALLGSRPRYIAALRTPTQIPEWQATVYMEDTFSHTTYCSPANRFYECLQLGMPQLFDVASANTMRLAGYDIGDYVVADAKEVKFRLQYAEVIRQNQRRAWHRNYETELRSQVRRAARATFGAKCLRPA